jgi:molecular chaperone GrpE
MEKEKKDAASPEEVAGVTTENMEDLTGMSAGAALESAAPEGDEGAETVPGGPETEAAAADWAREKEELVSLVQRKQADLDNFRRISRMKEEEIRTYGLFNFLEKLLPVLDNMERALVTAREDEGVPESHLKGLLMIRKQLLQLLEQEGVVEIEAVGKQFDPHYHDAVMQTAAGGGDPGSVVEELQKGYLYKDRVLRHAKVKVMQSQL